MTNIILPQLGEGITKAAIACWHVKVGDNVHVGQEVCEVVTDKASFVIEAPVAGRLQAIMVSESREGEVGCVLGVIE